MRPNLTMRKEGKYLYFQKDGESKQIRYNLASHQMQRSDDSKGWVNVLHQYKYFSGYKVHDVQFTDEKFKKFISLIARALGRKCESLSTFITRIYEFRHLESYVSEGVEFDMPRPYYSFDRVSPPKMSLYTFPKNVIRFFRKYNIPVDNMFIRSYNENKDVFDSLIQKLDNVDISREQKDRAFYLIFKRQNRMFSDLMDVYNYDFTSLVGYIFGYLEDFENISGIEAVRLLYDYYRMASQMGRSVDKYPKYLRSIHDIIQKNYNSYKREYDKELFQDMVKQHAQHLEYKPSGEKFGVLYPNYPDEIVEEGVQLGHCVSSYVDRILEGRCMIVFLREQKREDSSLVTVEVKGNEITQAKGSYNRGLTDDEKQFLKKFARVKKLQLVST